MVERAQGTSATAVRQDTTRREDPPIVRRGKRVVGEGDSPPAKSTSNPTPGAGSAAPKSPPLQPVTKDPKDRTPPAPAAGGPQPSPGQTALAGNVNSADIAVIKEAKKNHPPHYSVFKITFDTAQGIAQHEFEIADGNKPQQYPKYILATGALGPCVGVMAWNEELKKVGGGHVDTQTTMESVENFLLAVASGSRGKTKVYLIGGADSAKDFRGTEGLQAELIRMVNKSDRLELVFVDLGDNGAAAKMYKSNPTQSDLKIAAQGAKRVAINAKTGQVSNSYEFSNGTIDLGLHYAARLKLASAASQGESKIPLFERSESISFFEDQAKKQR